MAGITILQDATVYRGGVTARRLGAETREVQCEPDRGISLSFTISSKGGGTTEVCVRIGPEDFPALLETMSAVDRQAAMAGMAAELARQVKEQPEHDSAIAQRARRSVVELAQQKVWRARADNRDAENLVWSRVSKLVEELSASDKKRTGNKAA